MNIKQTHKVETESVQLVFLCQIAKAVHDEAARHSTFARKFVSARRTVRKTSVLVMTVVVSGKGLCKRGIFRAVGVVVNHIHYHTHPFLMYCVDKLLELSYPVGAVVWISSVASLGNVVVERIVSPVEACLGVVLVYRLGVKHRKQMNMRNTK